MAGHIHEWHGYLGTDRTRRARDSVRHNRCPFVPGPCTKTGGVCSVEPSTTSRDAVPVCPKRLYFDRYRALASIASLAFGTGPIPDAAGLPKLHAGRRATQAARRARRPAVGVFGKGFGGEITLPPAPGGTARYSVDYVLVLVAANGDLEEIVPVEVQAIDTTGSYKASRTGLAGRSRQIVPSSFGMNWENVNKRILPQLIIKGLMLQGERLCRNGLFFLTPEPVHERVMIRLGGDERFRRIPRQPGSITFMRLAYGALPAPGHTQALTLRNPLTISTSDLSIAFISPENLPPAGAYEERVRERL